MAGKWIQKANIKKGGLHKSLGIPAGQKIPTSDLSTKPGDSSLVKKQKNLARVFKGMSKGSHGIGKKA